MTMKKIMIALAAVTSIAVLKGPAFLASNASDLGAAAPIAAAQAQPVPAPVVPPGGVIQVQAARMGTSITLGGTVVPYKEVTLTAQIPGRVEFLAGGEGDHFKKGAKLVKINDDQLQAQRRAAVAQLANAQAAIANAQAQYSREIWSPQSRSIYRQPSGMQMPAMFDQMFTRPFSEMMPGPERGNPWVERQADIANYGSRLSQAQAQAMQAKSQIEAIDAKIKDSLSIAPFDGVIVKKLVEEGDTVQPGQPLLVYADTKYLQLRVEVPVRLVSGLHKGMLIPGRLDVGNTRLKVRVAQIFPAADPQRHTVTVKFDLPEGSPGGPGMYGEVMVPDVNAPVSTVPVIPDTAIVWRGSLPAVYVVDDQGHSRLRLVRLGDYTGPNTVAVLSGLRVGERIRVNPPAGQGGWNRRQ